MRTLNSSRPKVLLRALWGGVASIGRADGTSAGQICRCLYRALIIATIVDTFETVQTR